MSIKPRGIRNNNPGNIRRNGDPWQGLAETQGDKEFFTFTTPVYGIRALARPEKARPTYPVYAPAPP